MSTDLPMTAVELMIVEQLVISIAKLQTMQSKFNVFCQTICMYFSTCLNSPEIVVEPSGVENSIVDDDG